MAVFLTAKGKKSQSSTEWRLQNALFSGACDISANFFWIGRHFPVAFKNRLGHIAVVAANNNAAAPRWTDYPRTLGNERV
jgi:hypothetical protein